MLPPYFLNFKIKKKKYKMSNIKMYNSLNYNDIKLFSKIKKRPHRSLFFIKT